MKRHRIEALLFAVLALALLYLYTLLISDSAQTPMWIANGVGLLGALCVIKSGESTYRYLEARTARRWRDREPGPPGPTTPPR